MIGDMVNRQTGRYRYIKELKELKRELERVGFTKKKKQWKFYVRKRERDREISSLSSAASMKSRSVKQNQDFFMMN